MAQINVSADDYPEVCHLRNTLPVTQKMSEMWLWSTTDKLFIMVAIPFVSGIGIIANGSFIITVIKSSGMQTVANFYLSMLAINDIYLLLMAFAYHFTLYFNSDVKYNGPWYSNMDCWFVWLSVYFGTFTSHALITLVSLERCVAICSPLKYGVYKGKTRTAKWMAAVFFFAFSHAILGLLRRGHLKVFCLIWSDIIDVKESVTIYRVCSPMHTLHTKADVIVEAEYNVVYIMLLITNIIAYVKIVKALGNRLISHDHETIQHSVRNQVARLLIINGIVYFMCHVPIRITSMMHIFSSFGMDILNNNQYQTFVLASRCFMLLNSALNPFIYAFCSQFYRNAFLEAFGINRRVKRDTVMNTFSLNSAPLSQTV